MKNLIVKAWIGLAVLLTFLTLFGITGVFALVILLTIVTVYLLKGDKR